MSTIASRSMQTIRSLSTTVSSARPVQLGRNEQRSEYTTEVATHSGTLSVKELNQMGPMRSSHTSSREVAVTQLTFKPTGDYYKNAKRIDVEILPVVDGGNYQRNKTVTVSLTRQADGSFKSPALASDKAWINAFSETGYSAQTLDGFNFSLKDQNGKRDDVYGKGYGATN